MASCCRACQSNTETANGATYLCVAWSLDAALGCYVYFALDRGNQFNPGKAQRVCCCMRVMAAGCSLHAPLLIRLPIVLAVPNFTYNFVPDSGYIGSGVLPVSGWLAH